jgi:glycosyltransferase involved in cell wall biosynthesis
VHLSHIAFGRPLSWSKDFGDHTHVASADARQWAIDAGGVPADRVTLIPHGLHVERYPRVDAAPRRAARQRFNVVETDRVACYVGRLDDPKNETWLLDVVDRARERVPNLKLLVAGAGPRAGQFNAGIAARGLGDRVIALGELSDPLPVYQASDAFLLASHQEGFSLGCAEAMCVGVAPLRTRTAGTTELIIENVTGRSTAIDHDAFVAAAVDFLDDADALRRMGDSAAEHIRANFTFQRQLRDTIALYERLRSADKPAGAP